MKNTTKMALIFFILGMTVMFVAEMNKTQKNIDNIFK